MVALDEGLFDEDCDQCFEFALLVAASLHHLPQKLPETGDVLLVVCYEAFVSDHLDKVAEGAKAAHHGILGTRALFLLPNLLENGFNVIVLDETPKDLAAIHAKKPFENHFVLGGKLLISSETVDLVEVRVPIVELFDAHVAIVSIDVIVEVPFQEVQHFTFFLRSRESLLRNLLRLCSSLILFGHL